MNGCSGCFVWVPSVSSNNLKPVKPGPFGNDDRCNPENYDDVGRWYTHKQFGTWAPGVTSFEEWDIWKEANPGLAEAAALDACNKPPEPWHDPNAYRGDDEFGDCPRGMHFEFNDGDYNGGRCVPNKKKSKKRSQKTKPKKKKNTYTYTYDDCGC